MRKNIPCFPLTGFTQIIDMILLIIISLTAAFFVFWSAAGVIPGWVAVFFPVSAVIFWVWRLSFSRSLFLAILVGFLWDTVSILHFGTYLFTFFALVLTAEFFKNFFSKNDAVLSQVISASALFLIFFVVSQILQPILNLYVQVQ